MQLLEERIRRDGKVFPGDVLKVGSFLTHQLDAELLDAVCAGRGWLLKGGRFDYDRCCSVVLDEYRAGKLGRITFEAPPQINTEDTESND